MTLFSQAIDGLWCGIHAAAGVTVTYWQDGSSFQVEAVPGATRTETDLDGGPVLSDRSVDFIIRVADLDTQSVTPSTGDLIVWDGREYSVLSLGFDRHYRESSPHRKLYRIHTKETM